MLGGNEITTASNLNVAMGDNNLGSFDFYLEHQLNGDLSIDLGDGPRKVDFLGANNTINGGFSLVAGDNNQELYLDTFAGLSVAGTTTIDLGAGDDLVQINNLASFSDNVSLIDVNRIDLVGELSTKGDLNIDVSNDTDTLLFHA